MPRQAPPEIRANKYFNNSINIPLHELRERVHELPSDKPIVVHCEGGYRSATGASIVEKAFQEVVAYDLSEAIKQFKKEPVTS